eukprot:14631476-Alexandrium_andersonii.AAC.1
MTQLRTVRAVRVHSLPVMLGVRSPWCMVQSEVPGVLVGGSSLEAPHPVHDSFKVRLQLAIVGLVHAGCLRCRSSRSHE